MREIQLHLPTRLLATAEAFLHREGGTGSLSELAKEVIGDRAFFTRLRGSAKGISSRSYDRFQAHFISRGYDPDELARSGAAILANDEADEGEG